MFSFENNMLHNKCKVKSVQYILKYKNKAVRVYYIPGITNGRFFFSLYSSIFCFPIFCHFLCHKNCALFPIIKAVRDFCHHLLYTEQYKRHINLLIAPSK